MVPLACSPVISKAPKTPPIRQATIKPIIDCWVGSNETLAYHAALWCNADLVESTVTRSDPTMVRPSMMVVDRSVSIFTTSDLATFFAR